MRFEVNHFLFDIFAWQVWDGIASMVLFFLFWQNFFSNELFFPKEWFKICNHVMLLNCNQIESEIKQIALSSICHILYLEAIVRKYSVNKVFFKNF